MVHRKIVSVTSATLIKACRNHIPHVRSAAAPMEACKNHIPHVPAAEAAAGSPWKSYGNPCTDTFYYLLADISFLEKKKDVSTSAFHDFHMKRLLPQAWSYCPLTTFKIIRNLEKYKSIMYDAIYWLHLNHPKTLAANLIPLLINFTHSSYVILNSILNHILKIESCNVHDLYARDPDFRCLHDAIADLFAESLKFDIQNFLKKEHDYDDECDKLEVTDAADFCEASPFLLESVAKRVFPHVEDVVAAAQLLRNQVLDPLKKVLSVHVDHHPSSANIYGYKLRNPSTLGSDSWRKERLPDLHKYLKGLEKSPDKMVANALLPNELVECVIHNTGDISEQVVELQWKAMVEELKKKKGRHMSCSLGLIQPFLISSEYCSYSELTYAMAILFSELTEEEAWKGKIISLTPDPQLLSIQGHDLKSKCEFLCDPAKILTPSCGQTKKIDCKQVFDLILDRAVSKSLMPAQMIKKVFVFSILTEFEWVSAGSGGCWKVQDYNEMRRKYEEHGYDMPEIVFWRRDNHMDMPFTTERGIAAINGFHRAYQQYTWAAAHFVRMFLENDGTMSAQNVMDAILSDDHSNCTHRFVVLD